MPPSTEPNGAVRLDPALAALLADPRVELRAPSPGLSIDDLRKGARAFLTRASGPELHAVLPLTTGGEAGDILLRLYRPSAAQGLAAILFIHGGGFVFGDLDTHDGMCRTLAAETGAAVVAVDYRRAPEAVFPAASDDCFRALGWLARNAAQLDLDGGRLALAGDSAGGQHAVATAIKAREEGVALRHLALLYPVVDYTCASPSSHRFAKGFMLSRDFLRWCWATYAGGVAHEGDPLFDLTCADLRGLPATTIVTAGHDPLHDEGVDLADRLEQAGGIVSRRDYPEMIHGFAGLPHFTPWALDALRHVGTALRNGLAVAPKADLAAS